MFLPRLFTYLLFLFLRRLLLLAQNRYCPYFLFENRLFPRTGTCPYFEQQQRMHPSCCYGDGTLVEWLTQPVRTLDATVGHGFDTRDRQLKSAFVPTGE